MNEVTVSFSVMDFQYNGQWYNWDVECRGFFKSDPGGCFEVGKHHFYRADQTHLDKLEIESIETFHNSGREGEIEPELLKLVPEAYNDLAHLCEDKLWNERDKYTF